MVKLIRLLWLKISRGIQLPSVKSTPNEKIEPVTEEKTSMSFVPGFGDDDLSKHIGIAIHNTWATFLRIKPQYERLVCVDRSFPAVYTNLCDSDLSAICDKRQNTWNSLPSSNVSWPAIFMIRAHSGYRAACQQAMSGQITESIPVLRSCLEHSLYALHVHKNKTALEAWNKQYGKNSPQKSISRMFHRKKLMDTLKETDEQVNSKLFPFVEQLYQLMIDFGGHPNQMAIDLNLTFAQEDDQIKIKLLHNDTELIKASMAFVTEVGFTCLLIFKNIFPKYFDDHGVNSTINEFEKNLSSRQKVIEDFLTNQMRQA